MNKKISFILAITVLIGSLMACLGSSNVAESTEKAPEAQFTEDGDTNEVPLTEQPARINTSASETTRGVPAEALVEYPNFMHPKTQDTVVLTLLALPELASNNPETISFARITPGAPPNVGEVDYSRAYIMAGDAVEARLFWQNEQVSASSPALKALDTTGSDPSTWVWIITAPDTLGRQTLQMDVYIVGDDNPTWQGFFQVEIVEQASRTPPPAGTPAPTPTATPVPLTDQFTEGLGSITTLVAAIGALVAAVAGVMAAVKKIRGDDEKDKKA